MTSARQHVRICASADVHFHSCCVNHREIVAGINKKNNTPSIRIERVIKRKRVTISVRGGFREKYASMSRRKITFFYSLPTGIRSLSRGPCAFPVPFSENRAGPRIRILCIVILLAREFRTVCDLAKEIGDFSHFLLRLRVIFCTSLCAVYGLGYRTDVRLTLLAEKWSSIGSYVAPILMYVYLTYVDRK